MHGRRRTAFGGDQADQTVTASQVDNVAGILPSRKMLEKKARTNIEAVARKYIGMVADQVSVFSSR